MTEKFARNDPCHCGSGKKYKNCCQDKDKNKLSMKLGIAGVVIALILGIVIVGMVLSAGESRENCPPGTVWSDAHQHCH